MLQTLPQRYFVVPPPEQGLFFRRKRFPQNLIQTLVSVVETGVPAKVPLFLGKVPEVETQLLVLIWKQFDISSRQVEHSCCGLCTSGWRFLSAIMSESRKNIVEK